MKDTLGLGVLNYLRKEVYQFSELIERIIAMNEKFLKVEKDSIVLKPIKDVPIWKGSNIAEAFEAKGKTKLAAGMTFPPKTGPKTGVRSGE